MLPRTCTILLLLSLLSAAASVADRTTSASGAKNSSQGRAVGSLALQKRPAAGRKPPGKAQGQGPGTQYRRPGQKRPSRRPQRRPAQGTQTSTYVVCYLYPAAPPPYQDIPPSPPFVGVGNGPAYPPYNSYRVSQSANARNRASDRATNKLYGPQAGYYSPPYPIRLLCPLYQPVSANAVVSPLQVSGSAGNDSGNMLATDDPDIPVVSVDPPIFNLPGDGDLPLPYNNVYGPSGLDPEITYPPGEYINPQPFGYPPPVPFPPNF